MSFRGGVVVVIFVSNPTSVEVVLGLCLVEVGVLTIFRVRKV